MVKACIDHKSGLTPGGHNITIDIIPNDIAARCLEMGRKVLDEETDWLTVDPEKQRATSRLSPAPALIVSQTFFSACASNGAHQPAVRRLATLVCAFAYEASHILDGTRGRGDSPWAI